MARLRSQEVAALRRALDTERSTARLAQDRARELQQALDGERSAVRALRREVAAAVKAVRDEEAKKYATLAEQLRTRLELSQQEQSLAAREQLTRQLSAQFARETAAREEQWRKEARRQLEPLQEQLREMQRGFQEPSPRSEVEALVHSLHAEFHRTLHQKQEEWKREAKAQEEALTTQLRELQRLYNDTCNKLSTTTNENENIPKLRQEIQSLKLQNKELDERIQMLMEADRRKVEEFRSEHEANAARIAELQRAARKEAFQLLEELKSKTRALSQLQREYHILGTRLGGGLSSSASSHGRLQSSVLRLDDRPGEPPRLCIKRPKALTFASDVNKRLRAQEGRKPPDPPEPHADHTNTEDDHKNNENSKTNSSESLKETSETNPSDLIKNWTKTVGVETLYQLLLEEHQELQKAHFNAMTKLKEEEQTRLHLEEQLKGLEQERGKESDNAINLALAEQIQALQERQADLEAEAQELREQNDLLEFRILELDDAVSVGAHSCTSFHFKSPSSRSPDTREREIDDISDSGIMSLPTSEDISEADFQDFKMEPNNRDVKSKLSQLCQSLESVSERISIQQALSLLRHYEMRLEHLEATLATVCQEATQTKSLDHLPGNIDYAKSPSRIIATVLPFTDLSSTYQGKDVKEDIPLKRLIREQDCMQESGIFEDGVLPNCCLNISTQTDWVFDAPPGDLGFEIRKLTQIRERIEEKGGNKKLLKSTDVDPQYLTHPTLKELLFYRERVQTLEDRLAIYESKGDEQSKLLAKRLEREVLLSAQAKQLKSALRRLKEENQLLEEEKCEFEEAENDTRLRCQKLEVKLSALGEKKSDLQVQLQQNARTMANLRSSLSEEERKRNEARQYAAKMEAFANRLEQQNFEMEEKEMEIRYRLHSLENVVPAMVMYYLWKMLNEVRPLLNTDKEIFRSSKSDSILAIKPSICTEEKVNNIRSNKYHRKPKKDQLETLKYTLEDIELFLNSRHEGDIPESSEMAVDAAYLFIERLTEKCKEMEERIIGLELKEKVYQETLQNGDELLSKMELDYKDQLKCMEDELYLREVELGEAVSQLRKQSGNEELELQFEERVNQLESEIRQLREGLAQKDKEKKTLEEGKIRLISELEQSNQSLEQFKESVEKPLREEVEYQKKRVRELLGDLDLKEQEKEESDEQHRKLVRELKKINHQAWKELMENEVTISELKEEVQTLEVEVKSLREALSAERHSSEQLAAELVVERRDNELQQSLERSSTASSLHEELLDATLDAAERQVDATQSTMDAAVFGSSLLTAASHDKYDCQRAEQIIKEFDPSNITPKTIDLVASAYQHSRPCRHCKLTTPVELRGILNLLQKTAPKSKMAQINHLLLLR